MVKLSSGETIRVRPDNLRALLNEYHPLLLTPTALDDPANLWCLPPAPLWWSNAMLDLQADLHTVMAEIDRAGVTDGLTFQAPSATLDPGLSTDRQLGRAILLHASAPVPLRAAAPRVEVRGWLACLVLGV